MTSFPYISDHWQKMNYTRKIVPSLRNQLPGMPVNWKTLLLSFMAYYFVMPRSAQLHHVLIQSLCRWRNIFRGDNWLHRDLLRHYLCTFAVGLLNKDRISSLNFLFSLSLADCMDKRLCNGKNETSIYKVNSTCIVNISSIKNTDQNGVLNV